ncbi:hypothetical protein K432DRAFT_359411 [Lepidopterella palustris CBS 459.81]|uniref:YMC020W-like alpha/beta hydrolase domain-containing protein n=1 Tax=Lepidopterella palustris CBS 459.81 TaxID=1314670 RepID=A0A8E2E403_9PEZI|nr:hypothetical protein K432DRAFT_359411 [Lepidopterella palustris CBS 459.81]
MSPRKKSKPNPKAPASGTTEEPENSILPQPLNGQATPETTESTPKGQCRTPTTELTNITNGAANSINGISARPQQNKKPGRSWYGGSGSWSSKAPPIAQIAKENIGVAGGATAELAAEGAKQLAANSPTKLLSKRRSSKGDPISASMTKLNITSSSSVDKQGASEVPAENPKATPEAPKESPEAPKQKEPDPPLPPEPPKANSREEKDEPGGKKPSVVPSVWKSWWSRPDGYASDANKGKDGTKPEDSMDARTTPLPGSTPLEESPDIPKILRDVANGQTVVEQPAGDKPADQNAESKDTLDAKPEVKSTTDEGTQSKSWFWSWSSTQNVQSNLTSAERAPENTQNTATTQDPDTTNIPSPAPITKDNPTETEIASAGSTNIATKSPPSKSSGWAFWSREKPKSSEISHPGSTHKQVGELAVADTPSQSHPEAAQFNEQETPLKNKPARSLRGRPKGKDSCKDSSKPSTPSKSTPSHIPTQASATAIPQTTPKQALKTKQEPANIILPEFRKTYNLAQKPSYWQQIRQYFLGDEPEMPHLHINPSPLHIKKAIAIGVHGYFPAPLLQKVLGQPTGTSIRFANAAAAAIQEWSEAHGYSTEIEKVALEGEGFIADRVGTLWKLLLNWVDHIKSADFILVACHSQGVPVAIMLVAKLIQFGCVESSRIGVCAMAGVNLGPFAEYKTRYLGGTAAELFEFSSPNSIVSQMYLSALEEALRYGVRIVYVGSIDDQLVSLESSTFSTISHPYIYRAVFVDGRIHAPDFITHLVGFALKLRNLGLSDHGLIRELSPALAGSLYTGEGHSRIYDDHKVYLLAVCHALETTSLPLPPAYQRPSTAAGVRVKGEGGEQAREPYALKVREYELGGGQQNPYFLPWAMRGLLEEEFVKRELGGEVEELLGLFESWRPVGKGLKDVRFRLEAVRSKL